jgi:hypothetical protein
MFEMNVDTGALLNWDGKMSYEGVSESNRRRAIHGKWNHPLYDTWVSMIARCENPRAVGYKNYGGRGIKVCDRWHDVVLFIADIGSIIGPRPLGRTLDRKHNDKDYGPTNVRWATPKQQAANRRKPRGRPDKRAFSSSVERAIIVSHDRGVSIAELANIHGRSRTAIYNVLMRNPNV